MSNTGKYNKRVKIVFRGEATPTPLGGSTFAPGEERDVWASVEQLSMSENLRNGLVSSDIAYRVKFIYNSVNTISSVDYIYYGSRKCSIVSVRNVGEADREMEILANEQR